MAIVKFDRIGPTVPSPFLRLTRILQLCSGDGVNVTRG
jgi:hypothetical protein